MPPLARRAEPTYDALSSAGGPDMPELNVQNRTIFTGDNLDILRGLNSK